MQPLGFVFEYITLLVNLLVYCHHYKTCYRIESGESRDGHKLGMIELGVKSQIIKDSHTMKSSLQWAAIKNFSAGK